MPMIGAQVSRELAEKVRNLAYWKKISVSSIVEKALYDWLAIPDNEEQANKKRDGELRRGRGPSKKNVKEDSPIDDLNGTYPGDDVVC